MEQFKWVKIHKVIGSNGTLELLSPEVIEKVRNFHKSFPVYEPTPLVSLPDAADGLGLGAIYVKDESYRFGLNAFKVLGGSFAIGNYIAGRLGVEISRLSYEKMISDEARRKLGEITFVTATDGNHGRGVAWTANKLKQSSVVLMPKGSSQERLRNIRAEGAEAYITGLNYDDAVRLADQKGQEKGWVMVQDTAWDGYEDIPTWIIQGYGTMAHEAYEQLGKRPTHIFIQAGVGSLAGAVAGYFTNMYKDCKPIIVIVEPNKADCIYRTALADDGNRHFVTDDMDTIMVGLACGEPCSIGWEILKETADFSVSCPDYAAENGMRILGNPAGSDSRVISGESGAAGFGCAAEIMTDPQLSGLRDELGLGKDSTVLFFSTEGDTDRESYRKIVG